METDPEKTFSFNNKYEIKKPLKTKKKVTAIPPLLKNEKVFLSPHAAAFTEECMTRMAIETIQNIFDFFDGKLEDSKKVKL